MNTILIIVGILIIIAFFMILGYAIYLHDRMRQIEKEHERIMKEFEDAH